ncbi:MAG: Asp-tRNA(Asn)/Glu-tRNA(Gln) amidotransferase subunit GatC [Clostridia bacterium]|jgi:aspartyl-tRNA(Asn)/glutamyl-tRNA(Gln) amidotransferase subunit C|nr:Asp-tRNA(Asn)/Glu-tRNA(Gln) amidotransferase subunit GatC [Clostridia bacterium]MDD4408371.1 Asp-tRNA(Asn)/Glu-tRNA(Gln) amidotransferase subunit GatC [Clostridia bacterium]
MKITLNDVDYLANLSALEFTEDEKKQFLTDFNNILEMVNKLQNQKTDNVEVYNKSHSLNDLREDEIEQSFSQKEVLENAPKQRRGCFNVPLIVE